MTSRAFTAKIEVNPDWTAPSQARSGFPFQSTFWLASWFEVLAPKDMICSFRLTVADADSRPILALPLLLRRSRGLRQIEMPDAGASDYLAPLAFPDTDASLLDSDALWRTIRAALPPADIVRFTGLRTEFEGGANPLARHPFARPSRTIGTDVDLSCGWDAYLKGLSHRTQSDLRAWRRRFEKSPGARIEFARDADTAEAWLDTLDAMQTERLGQKGIETLLNKPEFAAFYRAVARRGIATGEVLLARMFAGATTVALGFALRDGDRAVYVRVGALQGEWARMRPGILISETIMKHACAAGVRIFDFGLGDYDYKRRLGARSVGIVDLDVPLSIRGQAMAAWYQARRRLSGNALLRRLSGRDPAPEPAAILH